MPRYYKGHGLKDDEHIAIFKLEDEPQKWLFGLGGGKDKTYIITAEYVDHSGLKRYETVEDCGKDFVIRSEICEEEYHYYLKIQKILTELYMGPRGGYPRPDTVKIIARELYREAVDVCNIMFLFDERRTKNG